MVFSSLCYVESVNSIGVMLNLLGESKARGAFKEVIYEGVSSRGLISSSSIYHS